MLNVPSTEALPPLSTSASARVVPYVTGAIVGSSVMTGVALSTVIVCATGSAAR